MEFCCCCFFGLGYGHGYIKYHLSITHHFHNSTLIRNSTNFVLYIAKSLDTFDWSFSVCPAHQCAAVTMWFKPFSTTSIVYRTKRLWLSLSLKKTKNRNVFLVFPRKKIQSSLGFYLTVRSHIMLLSAHAIRMWMWRRFLQNWEQKIWTALKKSQKIWNRNNKWWITTISEKLLKIILIKEMKERIKLEFKMNERTNTNERTEKKQWKKYYEWLRERKATDRTSHQRCCCCKISDHLTKVIKP